MCRWTWLCSKKKKKRKNFIGKQKEGWILLSPWLSDPWSLLHYTLIFFRTPGKVILLDNLIMSLVEILRIGQWLWIWDRSKQRRIPSKSISFYSESLSHSDPNRRPWVLRPSHFVSASASPPGSTCITHSEGPLGPLTSRLRFVCSRWENPNSER